MLIGPRAMAEGAGHRRRIFSNRWILNETEGFSLIFVARNGKCVGWVGLQDQDPRRSARGAGELRATGVRRIAMVCGDRQPVAARVAARNWLRRGHRRVPAAEQGGVCAPDQSQGIPRGGDRRRCERRARPGRGRSGHRHGRGREAKWPSTAPPSR